MQYITVIAHFLNTMQVLLQH